MATEKYEFDEITGNTQGWNALLANIVNLMDQHLHTRLLVTLGEAVAAYVPVHISGDGKAYKAQANRSACPAVGLLIEAGEADDEVRAQRVGPITNSGWTWTPGKPVWLDPDTAGGLTQAWQPGPYRQMLGIAVSATCLVLGGGIDHEALASTTTTTTTTSTSTSTSTAAPTTTTTEAPATTTTEAPTTTTTAAGTTTTTSA